MPETYNGYTNYQTWLVSVWMDNDEGVHDHWIEIAKEEYSRAEESKYLSKLQDAKCNLAELLKDYHEDGMSELRIDGLYADLLNDALECVDWIEIAGKLMDYVVE
jgi:hypothetical protein